MNRNLYPLRRDVAFQIFDADKERFVHVDDIACLAMRINVEEDVRFRIEITSEGSMGKVTPVVLDGL
jgi:hypothetical protein